MAKRLHDHIVHYTFPHKGNDFRPKLLGKSIITILLLVAIAVEGAYFFHKEVVLKNEQFLAAVLPSVLIALTNEDRVEAGLRSLTEDPLLTLAARQKAEDMASRGYFSHETPEGKEPWHFLELVGYQYQLAGENLAVNFEDSRDVSEAWMNSPSHRANIEKGTYTHIGIAVAKGEYKGKEAIFVVQFFATPAQAAAVPEPIEETPPPVVVADSGEVKSEEVVAPVVEEPVAPKAPLPEPILEAAASPTHTTAFVFGILGFFAGILFLLALIAHLRKPYLEALGGSFAVLVIVTGLLLVNSGLSPAIEITNEAAASAILAL